MSSYCSWSSAVMPGLQHCIGKKFSSCNLALFLLVAKTPCFGTNSITRFSIFSQYPRRFCEIYIGRNINFSFDTFKNAMFPFNFFLLRVLFLISKHNQLIARPLTSTTLLVPVVFRLQGLSIGLWSMHLVSLLKMMNLHLNWISKSTKGLIFLFSIGII